MDIGEGGEGGDPWWDFVAPPYVRNPDRAAEREGVQRCVKCGAPARWYPLADVWVSACVTHAPEDDFA